MFKTLPLKSGSQGLHFPSLSSPTSIGKGLSPTSESRMKNYKPVNKIQEGMYSEVTKMQKLPDGNYYACKQMKQHFESIEQVNNL